MYDVYVWVPSKGWKKLLSTRDEVKALRKAAEFLPLEVKVRYPSDLGRVIYGGILHFGEWKTTDYKYDIEERLAELLPDDPAAAEAACV